MYCGERSTRSAVSLPPRRAAVSDAPSSGGGGGSGGGGSNIGDSSLFQSLNQTNQSRFLLRLCWKRLFFALLKLAERAGNEFASAEM